MSRFFVIGLDGATFRIIDPLMNAGELPNLARLKHGGSSGTLCSTIHPFSAQAWSSFMTGKNPGKHGILDFVLHEDNSYRLKCVNANDRKGETIWRILSNYGLSVGVMNVPLTYPPEEVNGFLIAGMDAPGKESNFIYPSSLLTELETQVGPYTIELSIRDYMRHGLEEKFLDDLRHMIKQQIHSVKYLTSQKRWDFFIFVCRATDQVQHFYWRFMDHAHPYHPKTVSPKLENAIADIYKDLDAAIGEIEKEIGPETYFLIMSDHGQGPNGNRAFYTNKWLRSKGFLRFKKEQEATARKRIFGQKMISNGIDNLKKILPRKLKNSLFRRFPSLRDRVETILSFSDIDFEKTIAYSQDVRGNIWINLKGRQPKGQVRPEDYLKIREQLILLLQDLRDPETGKRITDKVFQREDLYSGEFLSKAPDVIFTQPNNTYTYMLRGSKTDRDLNRWLKTIPESELGVWPTSSHTLDGIFFLKGDGVNRGKWINGARIIDLAPTILYLMGFPIPNDMDGAVIQDAIDPDFLSSHPPKKISGDREEKVEMVSRSGYTEEEEAKIQERLKDLGYIE